MRQKYTNRVGENVFREVPGAGAAGGAGGRAAGPLLVGCALAIAVGGGGAGCGGVGGSGFRSFGDGGAPSADHGAPKPSGDGGGSGSPDAARAKPAGTYIMMTVTNRGKQPATGIIEGDDYDRGTGVKCKVSTFAGKTNFRIDARDNRTGPGSDLLLQYWNFSTYEVERDEDFAPPPPMIETFRLGGMIAEPEFVSYEDPSEWRDHLAERPACHTSFKRLDTEARGALTCTNLYNRREGALADVRVEFACPLRF